MTDHDPYAVTLWLATKLPNGDSDTLYTRIIRTAHTPRTGDHIHLWAETDDLAGERWDIASTWHEHDGRYHAALTPLFVNPTAETLERLRRSTSHFGLPWWSRDNSGDDLNLDALLAAAGWAEWDGS